MDPGVARSPAGNVLTRPTEQTLDIGRVRAAAARRSPPVRILKFLNGRSLWNILEPSVKTFPDSDRRRPTEQTLDIGRVRAAAAGTNMRAPFGGSPLSES